MGGFIQSLVYGFAGMRIRPEMLEFHHPRPPPESTMIRLRSVQYLGSNLTITIWATRVVEIYVNSIGADYNLILKRNDSSGYTGAEESLMPG